MSMSDSQRIEESRRAGSRIILSLASVALALILYITTIGIRYSDTATVIILLTFAVMFSGGWIAAVINAIIFVRLGSMNPKQRPPRITTLESEAHNRAVRLEARPRENQLLRSRYEFSPSDWRLLVHHLQPNYPKWTRRALEKTRLFDKITAPGTFEEICSEFERLGVISGRMYMWRITNQGWADLREAANLRTVR